MKIILQKNNPIYFILLLTTLSLLSCTSNDDIPEPIDDTVVSIPDIHFEKKLIELGIDTDQKINQRISKIDAQSVTSLNLNKYSNFGKIEDLSGIEGFTNITFLAAANQKLTDIDLSSNTKIDSLYLFGNSIKEINLSKNTSLKFVNLEANELHTVQGLPYATQLRTLNLSWNNFVDFNLINNSVEVLYITHNTLENFDITQAPNLKNILAISSNIPYVDLSKNTKLETLVISGNPLEEMDLQHNINLTHVYMSSTQLSQLDISHNKKLIDLRIDRNPSLTCIQKGENQEIPTLSLSDYQSLSENCD
ncbi:hypothetical protein [Wenyingzhuangia sp. IMCC45574]